MFSTQSLSLSLLNNSDLLPSGSEIYQDQKVLQWKEHKWDSGGQFKGISLTPPSRQMRGQCPEGSSGVTGFSCGLPGVGMSYLALEDTVNQGHLKDRSMQKGEP